MITKHHFKSRPHTVNSIETQWNITTRRLYIILRVKSMKMPSWAVQLSHRKKYSQIGLESAGSSKRRTLRKNKLSLTFRRRRVLRGSWKKNRCKLRTKPSNKTNNNNNLMTLKSWNNHPNKYLCSKNRKSNSKTFQSTVSLVIKGKMRIRTSLLTRLTQIYSVHI